MRKLTLLFALLALALPLRADRVSPEKAQEAARAFFQHDRNVALRMAPLRQVALASAPQTKAGEARPAYYIFNRTGGGFVIIAGEDVCTPVLAYSYENNFGTGADMPENLREWLDDVEEQIAFVRADGTRAPEEVRAWAALMAPTKAVRSDFQPALKHETPLWKQGAPFNGLTPVVDGEHTVTGCAPLAMAMLMRFFGYPLKGEGTLDSYSYTNAAGTTINIEGFDLGHPYEWDLIKFSYKDGYTEEEAAAVSRLVYDCGVAVQAKFDESTSASTPTMAGCAVKYFGFDPGAYFYKRELFTDAQWLEMLEEELQTQPILYSARRESGGHAFLLDGYDEAGNLSVNWGWGGTSNGYYALSAFTPTESRQYIYSHGAVFGLKPKEGDGGQSREYLYYQAGTSSSGNVYNGLVASEPLKAGHSVNMNVGYFYNGGIMPFEGEYCVVLVDAQGEIKDYLCPMKTINELKAGSGRGYNNVGCTLHVYPREGDRVKAIYRSLTWPADKWEYPLYDLSSDIVAEIFVTDETTLAEVTSLSYNKTSGEMVVETKDGVNWTLTNSSGASVTDCVTYEVTTLTIQTAELAKGTYKLALKRDADSLELTLKMGTK